MNRMFPKRSVVALTLALVLVLGVVPAYAGSGTVSNHVLIGGQDLIGKTEAEARVAIVAGSTPKVGAIVLKGDGHVWQRGASWVKSTVSVTNIEAMVAQSVASATDTTTLVPAYAVNATAVSAWSTGIAKMINHKATDAKRRVRGHSLVVSKEVAGHTIDKTAMSKRLTAAILSDAKSPSTKATVVWATTKTVNPKVTRKNIPKAILVVLSEFKIRLYKGTKIEKTYRCAVGQPNYPTPTGKFKVTGKVKNPTWRNPYSDWSKNMPAVIHGGVNNPLGTRAIYISASGIRMHGVPASENSSIGHRASHGCMRMKRHDAEDFYPRVPVGITVWIIK